jgi:thioredoxin-like negative regulator of GroEL
VRRSWLVSIDSLQAFRNTRQQGRELPGDDRATAESADTVAESPGNAIRELADRLVEEASRASEFRVRLELSERAESTLREELVEERRRREEAEREREDLRRELEALREARESPESPGPGESPTPAPGDAQEATQSAHSATLRPQGNEATGRPWWRRIFRG